MRVEFHPEAEMEFIEASAHYESAVPGLGERFILELIRAERLLIDQPEIGARVDNAFCRFVMGRFPYSLIYSVERADCG